MECRWSGDVRLADDAAAAEWIAPRLRSHSDRWLKVDHLIPSGYERYVRIFHPVYESEEHFVRWSTVAEQTGRVAHGRMDWDAISWPTNPDAPDRWRNAAPMEGTLPMRDGALLVDVLRQHTSTADLCWLAVWEGFGQLPRERKARLHHEWRDYVLLNGNIGAVKRPLWRYVDPGWEDYDDYQSPNLWWPDDRAWIVATDIDLPWTDIAGSRGCIEEILAQPALESFPVGEHDMTVDDINPARPREYRDALDELAEQWTRIRLDPTASMPPPEEMVRISPLLGELITMLVATSPAESDRMRRADDILVELHDFGVRVDLAYMERLIENVSPDALPQHLPTTQEQYDQWQREAVDARDARRSGGRDPL